MANKIKKISINTLEKCVAEASGEPTVTIEWHGIAVAVKRRLGLMEMMTFVDGVVKSCFTSGGVEYTPEVLDFATRCSILEMYANFSLPANVERRYELVYECGDLYQIILDNIDRLQFDDILRSIDDKIAHIAEANIEAITRQMNELYAAFERLQERLSTAFEGIDKETIDNLVGAISDGKFDEEKLVDTYFAKKRNETRQNTADGE